MHPKKADLLLRMRDVEFLAMRLSEEAWTYFNKGKVPMVDFDLRLSPAKFYSLVLEMADEAFDVEPEAKCPTFSIFGIARDG